MKKMNQASFSAIGHAKIPMRSIIGDGEGEGGGEGTPTAEQYAAIQAQMAEMQSNMDAIIAERDKYKAKHGEAEKHRKEQEDAARKAAEEAARKSGDVEAIENSWKEKYTNRETELLSQLGNKDSLIQKITVGAQATAIASELAIDGASIVLEPHIRSRLSMELKENNEVVIKVLGVDGKPSAMTLDDLKNEFKSSNAFATIIKGSNASGSGSANDKKGGGNAIKRSAFDALTPPEQSNFIRGGGKVVD